MPATPMTTAMAAPVAAMPIAIVVTTHTVILAAFAAIAILSAHRQPNDAEDH